VDPNSAPKEVNHLEDVESESEQSGGSGSLVGFKIEQVLSNSSKGSVLIANDIRITQYEIDKFQDVVPYPF